MGERIRVTRIRNPFAGSEGYNCFGCSPDNPIGFNLVFTDEDDEIATTWNPAPDYVGFSGVLHGGIQAALHDEIAGWFVFAKLGTAGFTSELSVRFLAPVLISKGPVSLRARLESRQDRIATLTTNLFDGEGTLCSEAHVAYYIVPEHIARRRFHYPGLQAFTDA